ncbi:ABC transporter substrate-binding protein [Geomicrobium sp. JCM 19039]|uniref:ABC transporter substrate-binding protein n=1 Tax=Geomicrobium sp. JCM 19039 TaxID=1460636 RepID=UPI00045F2B2E|nr:ABC transporter substrate-binding protein [Geomicrobium sp. JCM 19039]GAK13065.1 nitrate ABC transporter [Geomicrobium sp. JCM 19039]
MPRQYYAIPAILLLVSAIVMSGCQQREAAADNTIKVGYLPITHAAPLYIANEQQEQFMHDAEIELIRFGTWIDLMDALNSGRIDGASVLFPLAMKAREKGIDIKATALGHEDGNAIIASHDIQHVEDLHGKTVAIPHTLSTHNLLLDKMLENADMAYDDVNVVEMPPAEMPAALSEGRIESYIVAEPFGAIGVTLDVGHVLGQSHQLWPGCLCCAMVFRQSFLEDRPELAKQFMEGYVQAGEHAEDDLDAHLAYLNVEEEALELSLEWISYENLKVNREDYDYMTERVLDLNLMEQPPSYEEFVDTSLLEEIQRRP